MVSSELLKILCCPETRQDVRLASQTLIDELNRRIAQGKLQNRTGGTVQEPVHAGLLRADNTVLYPIRNDIPVMLIDEGICIGEDLRPLTAIAG